MRINIEKYFQWIFIYVIIEASRDKGDKKYSPIGPSGPGSPTISFHAYRKFKECFSLSWIQNCNFLPTEIYSPILPFAPRKIIFPISQYFKKPIFIF